MAAPDNTEWTAGFGVYLQPKPSVARYDAPLAAFGETRANRTVELRASLSNRKLEFLGFTPVVILVHARRDSSIDFYDYTRSRIEIGITRTF